LEKEKLDNIISKMIERLDLVECLKEMIDDVPLKVYSSVEAKLRDYPKIQTIIIQLKKLYRLLTEEKLAGSFTREIEDIFEYLKKALEEDLNKEEILKVINQFKSCCCFGRV